MEEEGCAALGSLLGRPDVMAFVTGNAADPWCAGAFDARDLPEGLDAQAAFDLVEFVRKTGAGCPACGLARPCGHADGWYAMTPALTARVAHLEYRARERGSLYRQLTAQLDRTGYYPAQLEELFCALTLDGVAVGYERLVELACDRRPPRTGAELLARNACRLLGAMDAHAGKPVTEELLGALYAGLEDGVQDVAFTAVQRPAGAHRSACSCFDARFVAQAASGPLVCPRPLFVLFCSDTAWRRPLFERWANTMELLVRAALLTSFDAPVLRYVPLTLPYWRWQSADGEERGGYRRSVAQTRYGLDQTALYAHMLEFWEQGLDDLASWVAERRRDDERCHGALEGCCALNHRQKALLGGMLDGGEQTVDAAAYGARFNVVPSTAYADLKKLVEQGLLTVSSQGKARRYRAASDIRVRVANGRLLGGRRH